MNIKVFNIRLDKENCQNDQRRMNEFLDSVEVKLTSANFVTTGKTDFWSSVIFYEQKKFNSISKTDESELTPKEKEIYNALKKWRNDLAQKLGWAAFMICHNSQLISVSKSKPENIEELEKIKGFGGTKNLKYGEDIISILNAL